jgi:hypothetical protein
VPFWRGTDIANRAGQLARLAPGTAAAPQPDSARQQQQQQRRQQCPEQRQLQQLCTEKAHGDARRQTDQGKVAGSVREYHRRRIMTFASKAGAMQQADRTMLPPPTAFLASKQ